MCPGLCAAAPSSAARRPAAQRRRLPRASQGPGAADTPFETRDGGAPRPPPCQRLLPTPGLPTPLPRVRTPAATRAPHTRRLSACARQQGPKEPCAQRPARRWGLGALLALRALALLTVPWARTHAHLHSRDHSHRLGLSHRSADPWKSGKLDLDGGDAVGATVDVSNDEEAPPDRLRLAWLSPICYTRPHTPSPPHSPGHGSS